MRAPFELDPAEGAVDVANHDDRSHAGPPPPIDIDELIQLLEDRILVEIQRRGGRFAEEF